MPELVPGLVSVIVPIYNVEAYLRDCLESLRSQTYRALQVIMVDDGATDSSVVIAEEFAAADDRFTLIRQANAGLSAARNNGLPHATGEYLAFVDSDDVLAAHAYETLVLALAGGADFASGGVHRYNSRGHYRGYPHDNAISITDLSTHVSENHKLLRDRTIWNKLFRRTFYDANGFEFPVGRLFEDVPVSVPAHANAKKVAIVNDAIYFWRAREGAVRSITQSDNDLRNLVDRFYSVNLVRKMLADSGHRELRKVYQEQAIWDKLSSYLRYLPAASQEYRATFMDLATKYLDSVSSGAVARQPIKMRPQWELIRQGKLDELIELIDKGFRAPAEIPPSPLESALRTVRWQDGKLELSGYAYVPGEAPSRLGSLRLMWLSADGSARKWPLRAKTYQDPEDEDPQPGGFTVTIDPSVLSSRGQWHNGTWTVAVAATSGVKVRRDGLQVAADWTDPLPRKRVADGVWVAPVVAKGKLRVRVTKSNGWLTGSHREGDDLILEGKLRSRPTGPVTVELNRGRGLVTYTVRADIDGTTFTARLPLNRFTVDDDTDNHATGLFAQRLAVYVTIKDKSTHLIADEGYDQTRTYFGTDEVYTSVAPSGYVSVCTRPAGPVATGAVWRPDGSLVLSGDSPRDLDGELLLRLRGRRKDVSLPLHVADGRWEVEVNPSEAPSLAGPLPLTDGTWDFSVRLAGHHHETVCPLGFTEDVRVTMPTSARAPDGVRSVLRQGVNERATVIVEPVKIDPAVAPRLQAKYFPAVAGSTPLREAALREAVLFDAAPGRRLADDPSALLAELLSRPGAPLVHWSVERGQPVPAGVTPVLLGSEAWYQALATDRWVVTNDDLPRWFTGRRGQTVLRLSGGWPVARFGAQAVAHPLGHELIDRIESDARSWTAVASPGPSATPILRRELRYAGEILEYGRPADDLLTTVPVDQARAEVLRRLELPPETRLVLYAPTKRPMDLRKRGWSDPGRLLDLPRVVAALPAGYELLARRHPGLEDDVIGLVPGVLDVSNYPNVAELLLAADVLITDYSSLLADFAVTGRASLLYVPDLEEFEASPGLNIDLEEASPGPLLRTTDEVVAAMQDLAAITAKWDEAAKSFAGTHRVSGGGQAAAKLVDWLLSSTGRTE
jgi:CDP-glycerol glycerophosphotransferase